MNNNKGVSSLSVLETSEVVQEARANWKLALLNRPCVEFQYSAITRFCEAANWFRHDTVVGVAAPNVQWVALARQNLGTGEQSDLQVHDDYGLSGYPPPTITVAVYLEAPQRGGELNVFASSVSTDSCASFRIQADDPQHRVILRIPHGVWHRPAPHIGLRQALVYTEVTEPFWSACI